VFTTPEMGVNISLGVIKFVLAYLTAKMIS